MITKIIIKIKNNIQMENPKIGIKQISTGVQTKIQQLQINANQKCIASMRQNKQQQIECLLQDDDEQINQWKMVNEKVYEQDHSFDQYIGMLRSKGAVISEKLQCGYFKLKNGLPYAGLYTKEDINQSLIKNGEGEQQILVCMPVQLLLTSCKAQKEAPQQLKHVYQTQQFYHSGPIWQNRILITYILYLLSNPNNQNTNIWYKMTSNFSKQIDILSFWSHEDILEFMDKSIGRAAEMQRNNFQKQWKQFVEVQKRNLLLQTNMFNYENYKWIYIHCISRCFGSFLNASYFVPFCQFLNHNCVDVSYYCLEQQQYQQRTQKPQTSSDPNPNSSPPPPQHPPSSILDTSLQSLSQQSANSEDYIEQDDFSYDKVSSYIIKWNSKISYNLKQKQIKQIQKLQKKIQVMLDQDVQWKGFCLLYIGEILQKCYVIVNQFMAERKKFGQAKDELEMLGYHVRGFRRHVIKYYKGLGCTYKRDKNAMILNSLYHQQKQIKQQIKPTPKHKQLPSSQNPDHQYTKFLMICHQTQHFPANSQVYFEYNRLSNRTLLLRYGFCLQNNKYEHVWVRKFLAKQIGQYPDLFKKMQQKCLPVTFKIKLKPYVLNTQFIITEKVQKWKIYGNVTQQNCKDFEKMFGIADLEEECEIIDRVIEIYEQQLPKYGGSLIDLTDKTLSYHSYFRAVYHNEKIRILKLQIKLLQKCKKIFNRILHEKITIKGNTNLLKELKKLCFDQLKCKQNVKMIWGYVKTMQFNTVS